MISNRYFKLFRNFLDKIKSRKTIETFDKPIVFKNLKLWFWDNERHKIVIGLEPTKFFARGLIYHSSFHTDVICRLCPVMPVTDK
jgi:hypothetical protein